MSRASAACAGVVRRIGIFAAAGSLALSAAEPPASETKSPPPREPPPGESLDAARRDFQSMKATRDPAQKPRDELPKFGLPSLPAGGGEALPTAPARREPATTPARKSGNWLVDAMDQREREAGGRRDDHRAERGLDELRDDLPLLRPRDREAAEGVARRMPPGGSRAPGSAIAEAGNPLAGFLGGWMTARDYAVLKPALEMPGGTRAPGDARESAPTEAVSRLPAGVTPGETGGGLAAMKPPNATRENPYLQTQPLIATPVIAPPRSAAAPGQIAGTGPTIAPPAVMPAAAAASPPVQPPPRSQIPDFAKPARDEKYFKQLKRF